MFLKKIDKKYLRKSNKLLWLYGAFLTFRYADDFDVFPAFQYNGFVKFKIYKNKGAKLILRGPIKLEQWLNLKSGSTLTLSPYSNLTVLNEFIIGNNVTVFVSHSGNLLLKGRINETGSGITANAVIMVKNYLEIGHDCIIAWDTYFTDADWHNVGGNNKNDDTIIEDHCWIGVGVKVLKGSRIKKDSIVGTNSVVTKQDFPEKCFLSGIPAKIIKTNIDEWKR